MSNLTEKKINKSIDKNDSKSFNISNSTIQLKDGSYKKLRNKDSYKEIYLEKENPINISDRKNKNNSMNSSHKSFNNITYDDDSFSDIKIIKTIQPERKKIITFADDVNFNNNKSNINFDDSCLSQKKNNIYINEDVKNQIIKKALIRHNSNKNIDEKKKDKEKIKNKNNEGNEEANKKKINKKIESINFSGNEEITNVSQSQKEDDEKLSLNNTDNFPYKKYEIKNSRNNLDKKLSYKKSFNDNKMIIDALIVEKKSNINNKSNNYISKTMYLNNNKNNLSPSSSFKYSNSQKIIKPSISHIPSEKELKKKRDEYFKNRRAKLILEKLSLNNSKKENKNIFLPKPKDSNHQKKNKNIKKHSLKHLINKKNDLNLSPIQKRKFHSNNKNNTEEKILEENEKEKEKENIFENKNENKKEEKESKNENNELIKNQNNTIKDDKTIIEVENENENDTSSRFSGKDNNQLHKNKKNVFRVLNNNNLYQQFKNNKNSPNNYLKNLQKKKLNYIDDNEEKEINKLIKLLKFKNNKLLIPLQELQKNNNQKEILENKEDDDKKFNRKKKLKDLYLMLGNISFKNKHNINKDKKLKDSIKKLLGERSSTTDNVKNKEKNQFLITNSSKYKIKEFKSIFDREKKDNDDAFSLRIKYNFLNGYLSPRIKSNSNNIKDNLNIENTYKNNTKVLENNMSIKSDKRNYNSFFDKSKFNSEHLLTQNLFSFEKKNKKIRRISFDFKNDNDRILFSFNKEKPNNFSKDTEKSSLSDRNFRSVFIMPVNPMNDIIDAKVSFLYK